MLQPSVELYFFNIAILLLLVLISFGPLFQGNRNFMANRTHKNTFFSFINFSLLLLYIVFQYVESDYWAYWGLFERQAELVEPLQSWIRSFFDNYSLWRLTVWGGAFSLMVFSLKRLGMNPVVFFPLFVLCYLSRFISREQLGLAVLFLGTTYILKPLKFRIISYVIGLSLITCSYFLHNSMIVSIVVLIPAFIKVNKKRALFTLVLFIPLVHFFSYVMGDDSFMEMFADFSTNTGDRIAIYKELETEKMNIYGLIRQLIYWSPMILMLCDVIIRSTKKRGAVRLPKVVNYYLNYWFYMFILSFVFYWTDSSAFVSVRFLDKSLFSMVLVLSYWFSVQKPNITMHVSLLIFLFYNILNYSLIIYNA